ncbi:hypothetical protein Tco_1429445 [Tanacetum coccineum]|uniref:Uncharacterized protein n=1 Tax=Tanacetum coccineum TaxID=301880 RepID=A0ABQ5GJW1_9ASTR
MGRFDTLGHVVEPGVVGFDPGCSHSHGFGFDSNDSDCWLGCYVAWEENRVVLIWFAICGGSVTGISLVEIGLGASHEDVIPWNVISVIVAIAELETGDCPACREVEL